MRAMRLGVLASGRGSNLQAILDASAEKLLASRVEVVVSDKPDAGALERARHRGIAAEHVAPPKEHAPDERRRVHDEQIVKVLRHFKVELVVLAGYMRIVSPVLIRAFPDRILNIHPALLPAFPGTHAQRQALQWGARVTGCTTHLVDEEVDHGPIILQASLPIQPDDSEETLSRRILAVEHQLLPRTIGLFEEGRVHLEGRKVRLDPGPGWRERRPPLPDVLYGAGY